MSMYACALDIETIPNEREFARFVEQGPDEPIKAPANWSDPGKIAAYVEKKTADWKADLSRICSFDPYLCRVASIALANSELEGVMTLGHFGYGRMPDEGGSDPDDAERALLSAFWKAIAQARGVVTFNGQDFDVPIINIRSAILGVRPTVSLETPRYRLSPNFDVFKWVTRWDRERSKGKGLANTCRVFGVACPGKEAGIDGSMVAGMAEAGEWARIAQYNLGDAQATWALFLRLQDAGLAGQLKPAGGA